MMRPEDVPAELVEKAARAAYEIDERSIGTLDLHPWSDVIEEHKEAWDVIARHALAAVLPGVQAQALRDAADTVAREVGIVWPPQRHTDVAEAASYAAEVLRANARAVHEGAPAPYAARLTATSGEPTT